MKARIVPKVDTSDRLDAIERQLRQVRSELENLSEFESRTEAVVERKVYEIKAVSYVTLIVASVLLALVLGMVLNALGVRFF
ncbi:hypothetical protein HYV43_04565 [Candidatus Micrarchaeota archaeon]|nr:hypothetical protein [Candidatus Micrarchaeota archaeon]